MADYTKQVLLPSNYTSQCNLYLKDGTQIATGFTTVVFGARGPYVEFVDNQLLATKFGVPKNQVWRMESPKWKDKVFYHEYRTYNCNIMIYHQMKTVDYADYKVGRWYISPWDLYLGGGKPGAVGTPPPEKLS